MKNLTSIEVLMALVVEVIRRLWDQGHYRTNPWLKKIVEEWFDVWVDFRTAATMRDVDRQIAELNPDPVELVAPVYWEEQTGDTPLGGAMGLTYEFTEDDKA
jgi:hypothetical protein